MKSTTCFSLFCLISSLYLAGCAGSRRTDAANSNSIEPAKIAILASVFRHLGEMYPTAPRYFFEVSDMEFRWLQEEFGSQPPSFRYARCHDADMANGDILYIRWIDAEPQKATARAGCRGKGYFADYFLHLVNERGTWHVVSCQLVCAS